MKQTSRGFDILEFTDRYGEKCSLQMSSLATESCVWLGITNPVIEEEGWNPTNPYMSRPLPKDKMTNLRVSGRMHLTQEQAANLIPHLQRFVDTGDLTDE